MDSFACLAYHGLSDCEFGSEPTQYTIAFDVFQEQMAWLRRNLYVVEDFGKLHTRLARDEALPERYVVLTFDDGYRTNLLAAELLARFGFSATFFLTAEYCQNGGKYLAHEDEIRRLVKDGRHSVGTHGYAHRPLGALPKVELVSELSRSRLWLESIVAQPVEFMAAPGGSISRFMLKQSFAMGYRLIGTSIERPNDRSVVQSTNIVNRVGMRRDWHMDTFKASVQGNPRFYRRRQIRALLRAVPKKLRWHYVELRRRKLWSEAQ